MANFGRLIRAIAEGGDAPVYWSRLWHLDEATQKKTLVAKRKYTVESVNEGAQTLRARVNDTDVVVMLTEDMFSRLYKKAPHLPDEA